MINLPGLDQVWGLFLGRYIFNGDLLCRISFTGLCSRRLRNGMAFILWANPTLQSPVVLPLWKSDQAVMIYVSLNFLSKQHQIVVYLQNDQHLPGRWWPPRVMWHHGVCCWRGSLEVMDLHQYDILQSKCKNCQMETGKPIPLPSATRQHPALLKGTMWSQASLEIPTLSPSKS